MGDTQKNHRPHIKSLTNHLISFWTCITSIIVWNIKQSKIIDFIENLHKRRLRWLFYTLPKWFRFKFHETNEKVFLINKKGERLSSDMKSINNLEIVKWKPQVPSSVSLFFFLSCCYFFPVKSISKSRYVCNFTPKNIVEKKVICFNMRDDRIKKIERTF